MTSHNAIGNAIERFPRIFPTRAHQRDLRNNRSKRSAPPPRHHQNGTPNPSKQSDEPPPWPVEPPRRRMMRTTERRGMPRRLTGGRSTSPATSPDISLTRPLLMPADLHCRADHLIHAQEARS